MTHEEQRELQVLSDAEAPPLFGKYYNFRNEPKLAATARRLAWEPFPRMIEATEASTLSGVALHVIRIRETGKLRLQEFRAKLAAEKH